MPILTIDNYRKTENVLAGIYQVRQAPWWLPTGIVSSNVIAAYQFKGAVDEATALLNVNDMSTYPLTKDSGITWNKNNGFYFPSGNYALNNTNLNTLVPNFIAFRFSDKASGGRRFLTDMNNNCAFSFGIPASYVSNNQELSLLTSDVRRFGNQTMTNGVVMADINNKQVYVNGSNVSMTSSVVKDSDNYLPRTIGGTNYTENSSTSANFQAAVFYSTVLTAAQVVELTISMQNL